MDEGHTFMICAVRLMVSKEQNCLHIMSIIFKGFFGGSLLVILLALCRDDLQFFSDFYWSHWLVL